MKLTDWFRRWRRPKVDLYIEIARAFAEKQTAQGLQLDRIERILTVMSPLLQTAVTEVQNVSDAEAAMEKVLEALFADVEASKDDSTGIQTIIDTARAQKAKIIAATLANTPADPNAPPASTPAPQPV